MRKNLNQTKPRHGNPEYLKFSHLLVKYLMHNVLKMEQFSLKTINLKTIEILKNDSFNESN